ncbi:MAG: two-component system, LytTR family, sensor kinase [Acidobacteriota bacterium]|jgi:two-component sensor histidine kinase|nr:two-component system, LytTR family, sensor kinase [Acidobacteriota bacterium]
MQDRAVQQRQLIKGSLIAAGWTLFGLFFASEVVVSHAYAGRPLKIGSAVAAWLICAFLWFAATPLILKLARRFPLERHEWPRSLIIHLAAGTLLSFLLLGLWVLLASAVGLEANQQPFLPAFRNQLVSSLHAEVLTYWMVIGLSHGIDYYRRYRERELRASQLETRLAQAQLDALKMQLHPHFLFNTLNSISVLMAEDVKAARRMLTRLSELLRASLENVGTDEVLLKEELEFLNNYLEIEQTRFQDRLTVRMQIEPAVLDVRVPNLILQPLVENAIRHGIAPRAQPGLIEVRAQRVNGMVELQVRDNGAGLGSATPQNVLKGIGLSNIQARLKQFYGLDHRFEMRQPNEGGLEVTIAIPFRNGTTPGGSIKD